ncbi:MULTISPECIES: LamB/YcsF family protein [unclassified Sphingobium]|uniref:LamB/YcsF family protein n=1 Tax=unclassified Sphingobium TaxID=2611147 RepID=UPI0019194601|nr:MULTISPECIES: 5-oxoprolinase subunit PxpA [unclassified Sphingobium]CAD7337136.1 5-oxoprolinase subunit A [Sphingobium sp. S6]CAD7337193.1 5-oxoprolinase subunit A [Sphingobium sp. S8]
MTERSEESPPSAAGSLPSIDLNADMGEGFGPWLMGDDEAMFALVSSANVACGGHASDPDTMFRTLSLARQHKVVTGAHPSYPDKEGFGRRRMPHSPDEIERFVAAQVGALMAIGALVGQPVAYVKPHGALGNVATVEKPVAAAIVAAVRAVDPGLAMLAISGTMLEQVARDSGMQVFSEIFADRGYTAAGNLVPRSEPGALIHDGAFAARRIVAFLESGMMPTVSHDPVALEAHSICVHGDSPDAVAMARTVRDELTERGFAIAPFLPYR